MTILNTAGAEILVFKTNLRLKKDLRRISEKISKEPRIKLWHVDIRDTDKVLRIEAVDLTAADIIQLIKHAGYHCEELPD
jgi:copper chaperone